MIKDCLIVKDHVLEIWKILYSNLRDGWMIILSKLPYFHKYSTIQPKPTIHNSILEDSESSQIIPQSFKFLQNFHNPHAIYYTFINEENEEIFNKEEDLKKEMLIVNEQESCDDNDHEEETEEQNHHPPLSSLYTSAHDSFGIYDYGCVSEWKLDLTHHQEH